MAKGFSNWLSPAFGGDLELRPDLDQVEALAPEREALWTRLEAASFLTDDEKRAAAGYGAKDKAPAALAGKYREDQPRIPAGNGRQSGEWTNGGSDHNDQLAMAKLVQGLLRGFSKTPKLLKPSEKPLHELLKPGGQELGTKLGSARPGIRTVTKKEFDALKSDVLDGASEIPAPPGYSGKWFSRPDGSKIGLRNSPASGETIEVIESLDANILKNGYKVHNK
jgi:hypothetical protein